MTNPVQDAVTTSVLLHLALHREARKDLAAVLGVDPSGVTKRLKGQRSWSLEDLDALARHWNVSPAQLLEPPVAAFGMRGSIGTGRKRAIVPTQRGGSVLTLPLRRVHFAEIAA